MYQTGYYATGYHSTGYFDTGRTIADVISDARTALIEGANRLIDAVSIDRLLSNESSQRPSLAGSQQRTMDSTNESRTATINHSGRSAKSTQGRTRLTFKGTNR